jgi:hypothetical protein
MHQLELFDSKVVFAIHLNSDELHKIRRHDYEAYQKLSIARSIMTHMAWLGKHEDFRLMKRLNRELDELLAN